MSDLYLCGCGGFYKLDHVDDIHTEWFKCSGCGQQKSSAQLVEGRMQTLELLKTIKSFQDWTNRELTLEELDGVLSLTMKEDYSTKTILFLLCLLAFTDSEQTNIILSGESSIGKTYLINEITWYFKDCDAVLSFEGASKTSFIHNSAAVLVDERNMKPILNSEAPSKAKGSTSEEWAEWYDRLRHKVSYLDYSRRILVLPDMPDCGLLSTLRSLTAHDKKRCTYSITVPSALRTKKVIIEGYFVPVYCTASTRIDEQETSRFFLLTPEWSQKKAKDAIEVIANKNSDSKYNEWYETNAERLSLRERVTFIKEKKIDRVFIPEDLMNQLKEWFLKKIDVLKPKVMRDFPRLISLCKAWCLFNCEHRQLDGKTLICNQTDIGVAEKLYDLIYESNELGLTPECLAFYENVVKPEIESGVGATLDDFCTKYFMVNQRPVGEYRLKGMLKNLGTLGLISKDSTVKPNLWTLLSKEKKPIEEGWIQCEK